VILLDTSAIYALADVRDLNHHRARELFRRALESGEVFLTHNYVLAESAALLQRRLGLGQALQFLKEAESFQVHWISPSDHRLAATILGQRDRRQLSLVDCASFMVMTFHGINAALAFDPDFEREGFIAYSGPTG
jgi:predicted nucleic acid-binding protein